MSVGAAGLSINGIVVELLDGLPGIEMDSGLSATDSSILWQIRLPRIVLGLLVGGMLALAGTSYQGIFRNPLADPYLLGVAAGAGLGIWVLVFSILAGVASLVAAGVLVPAHAAAGKLTVGDFLLRIAENSGLDAASPTAAERSLRGAGYKLPAPHRAATVGCQRGNSWRHAALPRPRRPARHPCRSQPRRPPRQVQVSSDTLLNLPVQWGPP